MTHLPADPGQRVYCIDPQVAIEGFDDGALALRLDDRHLFELNPTAQFVLEQTDGQRTLVQVAELMAHEFEITQAEALADLVTLYEELVAQHIVQIRDLQQNSEKGEMMAEACFIRNPDVGLREEDEDGGLLFNPDTNQVQVVNTTGLFIWKMCDGAHSLENIVNAMVEEFEGATVDEMTADARAFMDAMMQSGFLGTVEPMGAGGAANDG